MWLFRGIGGVACGIVCAGTGAGAEAGGADRDGTVAESGGTSVPLPSVAVFFRRF